MALNADHLLDRLRLKQQITKWRLIALIIGIIFLLTYVGNRGGDFSPVPSSYIARITIAETITDDDELLKLIEQGKSDKEIWDELLSSRGTLMAKPHLMK